MKVLFITNGFPPARWAGSETYTAGMAGELINKGHFVQVLCVGSWDNGSEYWNGYADDVYNGIPVRRLNLNWQKSSDPQKHLYKNPVVADFLKRYLEEIKPDLVHVTSCETLSASVLEVVKANQIPLVLSITDFWFLCPRINLLRSDGENCDGNTSPWECLQCMARNAKVHRWSQRALSEKGAEVLLTNISKVPLITRQRGFRGIVWNMADRKRYMRYVFSLPDARLVASSFVRDVHIQNGFDDPITLHSYGHDLSWLKNYQGKVDTGFITVGFIGQITHSKGVHLLLEAARCLSDLSNQVKFLIYGNLYKHPQYASKLEKLADGLGNITFCGTYPRESSAEVYSKIDVLVVPSLWYDFPLIIHEAFATKTPVIAANLGGMAEAVSHDVNGLLFERGNVEDLIRQIRRVVSEPRLMHKLKAGIPTVKSISEDIDEIEKIYQQLMESQSKSKIKGAWKG